jgi:beta-RFAP synthase
MGAHGLSGEMEDEAFQNISPSREQAAAISHTVLMALLPALAEGQLAEFGAALTQVQRLVGECFSPVQGDRFANPLSAELIERMLEWGAAGAGQSSWGPTVYGLVEGEDQGHSLKAYVQTMLDGRGEVNLVTFDNDGVQVQYL